MTGQGWRPTGLGAGFRARLAALGMVAALLPPAGLTNPANLATPVAAQVAAPFTVGAAVADYTPPCTGATGACPTVPAGFTDPASCAPPAGAVFGGQRLFAFTEPYVDQMGSGHYDLGDPFLDCPDGLTPPNGRWDGNYVGGGSNAPRYYTHVADPVTARAMVVANGSRTIAVEVLDHEGAFDVYLARIRAAAVALLPAGASLAAADIFISSTHDESAPDSIGLYGPSPASSSVNTFWADWFVQKSAQAVADAYRAMRPARVRYAEAVEPANLRQCWSSYPFVDDQLMPTLEAVDATTGAPIVTLSDVSQHTESLGFNGGGQLDAGHTLDAEKTWLTADWPYWFRSKLETDLGGVAIEMAGSVGSSETPEVFSALISRAPQREIGESHPAGCRTLFDAAGTKTPLGYYSETKALGQGLAVAVETALRGATDSASSAIAGARADVCIHITNALFAVGGAAGVFAVRPSYDDTCTVAVPPLPNGTSAGTAVKTQVAAFRIGDGEFAAVPGEVFPFTYLRGFMGPADFPCPDPGGGVCPGSTAFPLPAWLMPHMHTPYRFIDGLAEDMVGYIFPQGNGVGVPGEYPTANPQGTDTDRFGCNHSDDSEAASSKAADLIGAGLVTLLDQIGGGPEDVQPGRYVLPDGTVSRDPLGGPELKCAVDAVFKPNGPAVAVLVPGALACACAAAPASSAAVPASSAGAAARPSSAGAAPRASSAGAAAAAIVAAAAPDWKVVHPAAWMSLGGRTQSIPDRNTRGFVDGAGVRHWLDVYPDLSGAPASVTLGSTPSPSPRVLPNTAPAGGGPGWPAFALLLVLVAPALSGLRRGRRRG